MCRLLGTISREPKLIRQYILDAPHGLQALSRHGARAPHRDGVGWAYRDARGRMRLHRWGASALARAETLPGDLSVATTLLVAHARKASPEYRAALGALQAQPLVQDGLFLAHNGTIRDVAALDAGTGTDSQRLLNWVAQAWMPRTRDRLAEALTKIPGMIRDYTAINLLLTDGGFLCAFCLYTRDPDYYTLYWRAGDDAVVVASEPVDDQPGWRAFGNGELVMIQPDLSVDTLQVVRPDPSAPAPPAVLWGGAEGEWERDGAAS